VSQGALRSSARLAARSAVKIRAALATSITPSRVVAGYLDTHPVASDSRAQDRARARAWSMLHVSLDLEAYKKVLAKTYVDFYALGLNTAQEQMREATRSKKSLDKAGVVGVSGNPQTAFDPTFSIDWDTWTPGNEAAALLLNTPGGLKKLLGDINIQSRGIADTTHDLLGTALADGISKGWTPEDIADSLGDFISDPSRALTIAITEGQRAKIEANVQSYADNGVEQVEWTVNAPDDIDCIDNDGQIVNLGDEFNSGDTQPPVHPNCQCDLLPLMPDMTGYGDGGDSADQADMAVAADLAKYSESQARDPGGRFTSGGGDSTTSKHEAAYHATAIFEKASHAEPGVTSVMRELAGTHGTQLAGLNNRLKTVESLTRKIADDARRDYKGNVARAAREVSDAVRYTMVSDPKDYAASARAVTEDLRARGFDVRVKNYWQEGSNYKGVNVALTDHSGQKIELQFHTAESLAMKESTNHPIYEVYRKLDDTSTSSAQAMNAQMVANSATLSTPPGLQGFGTPKVAKFVDNKLQVRYYLEEGGL